MSQVQGNKRYSVGSKNLFIWIDYTRGEKNHSFSGIYLPWVDILNNIEVKELTCIEHHRVGWDQDPKQEKKYDGFIFIEENAKHQSGRWFNQYPSASYGQLSNAADYRVEADLTVAEIEALPDNKVWAMHEDATVLLERVLRGVRDLKEQNRNEESTSLSEFYDKVVKLLKDDFKVEVCVTPLKVQDKGGELRDVPGTYNVSLKPIS